jgi:pyruvate formate lyase activating enzyme
LATSCSRRDFIRTGTLAAGTLAACPTAFGAAPSRTENTIRPARYAEKLGDGSVRCVLCPRRCIVPPGGHGYCRVRENRAGTYATLVYGAACTTNVDPIEKKPFFHVLPGTTSFSLATVGCNMHCKFCQNWEISQASPGSLPAPFAPPSAIAEAARSRGSATVALTYSEPIVFYEYVVDCAREARSAGIGTVVVSNGFINAEPLKELAGLVSAIKIDLKGFTEKYYEEVCDASLQPVLDTLKRLQESGTWFEIVVLVVPTLNDAPEDLRRLSAWVAKELGRDVPLHFTRFHPTYKLQTLPRTPPETVLKAREIAMAEGCRFVYTGNMPGTDAEHTYCPGCKKAVIRRYGMKVLSNDLKDGRCGGCNTPIPGLWQIPPNRSPAK